MSPRLNPDWVNKLKPFKSDTTPEEKTNVITIVNQFRREQIFNHNYDENDIFNHIYKESSPAKRQPNPFMVFRMILGLIAAHNKTKIGDGTIQSKVAGYIWGGAVKDEKAIFDNISQRFKDLHKKKFPDYEYKPKPRTNPVTGTFAEPITSSHYESYESEDVSNQQILQESLISQQTSEDSNMWITNITTPLPISLENTLDATFILQGDQQPMQYQLQQPYLPYQLPPEMDQFLTSQEINLSEYHQMNQQLNPLNTVNTLNTVNALEKFEYPPQSTPTIAKNCINQSNQLDLNQPINFINQPYYNPYNNYYN